MKSLGPFPKSTSGPIKQLAHIICPLPTGDTSLGFIPIVSVSQAWIQEGNYFRIFTTSFACARSQTIVVPGISRFVNAGLMKSLSFQNDKFSSS